MTYKTAAELGITDVEYKGLIQVEKDLESGVVKYVDVPGEWDEAEHCISSSDLEPDDIKSQLFNMGNWHVSTACGTAHCIKGILVCRGVYGNPKSLRGENMYSDFLETLFLPPGDLQKLNWNHLTDKQAAFAIREFLKGNRKDCWHLALAAIPLNKED